VKSLINIAHGLDVRVIAEMIESEYEKQWLIQAGIDGIQGYYISEPSSILKLSEQ
jgi:EAL domain-containing protein (putative c-di-GMP-specific phosphodiesterase class I)